MIKLKRINPCAILKSLIYHLLTCILLLSGLFPLSIQLGQSYPNEQTIIYLPLASNPPTDSMSPAKANQTLPNLISNKLYRIVGQGCLCGPEDICEYANPNVRTRPFTIIDIVGKNVTSVLENPEIAFDVKPYEQVNLTECNVRPGEKLEFTLQFPNGKLVKQSNVSPYRKFGYTFKLTDPTGQYRFNIQSPNRQVNITGKINLKKPVASTLNNVEFVPDQIGQRFLTGFNFKPNETLRIYAFDTNRDFAGWHNAIADTNGELRLPITSSWQKYTFVADGTQSGQIISPEWASKSLESQPFGLSYILDIKQLRPIISDQILQLQEKYQNQIQTCQYDFDKSDPKSKVNRSYLVGTSSQDNNYTALLISGFNSNELVFVLIENKGWLPISTDAKGSTSLILPIENFSTNSFAINLLGEKSGWFQCGRILLP